MTKAYNIYQELIERAEFEGGPLSSSPNDRIIKLALERGEPIPDKLLPGRMIMRLSKEKREELMKLTSEETMHDRNINLYYGWYKKETNK